MPLKAVRKNNPPDLGEYLSEKRLTVDRALERYLPKSESALSGLAGLNEAMRYAVLGGGKRVRPILALASCCAVGGRERDVLPAACAIELIHSYSLVHDDLPCMDDDDLRRGEPACHRKFGEDTALLAGDALLTLAFRILSAAGTAGRERQILHMVGRIAEAAGARGMVGGQAVDLEFQGKDPDLPTLEFINTHKSGALIAVSVEAGAVLGGGSSKQISLLGSFGRSIGLLFQIVDDILDGEGYAKSLGETQARREAVMLAARAKKNLEPFGAKGQVLAAITDFILTRNS